MKKYTKLVISKNLERNESLYLTSTYFSRKDLFFFFLYQLFIWRNSKYFHYFYSNRLGLSYFEA